MAQADSPSLCDTKKICVPRPGGRSARGEACPFLRRPEAKAETTTSASGEDILVGSGLVVECALSGDPMLHASPEYLPWPSETHAWPLSHT